jgi:hypothetical protein
MKFYFPDSQDLVSPTYDFTHDEYSPLRVRQRDDLYAHEVLSAAPYDGILVSKAIVDGSVTGAGKYSGPQRERLYRLGVRRFFRLPHVVTTLGDCGAFNYVDEDEPPYSVNEVLDFYEHCGFDAGVSVDHVLLGYDRTATESFADPDWVRRRAISLRYAEAFLAAIQRRGSRVEPLGSAQGWSPASYADSVRELQDMGYRRIALGGMVPLKTRNILECLESIDEIRQSDVSLHLFGITRIDSIARFEQHGVGSFDSTSPFRQAFMDERNNYHTTGESYMAIRVPQVDGNPMLKRNILGGVVSQRDAIAAERECLKRLRRYDQNSVDLDDVLDVLDDYQRIAAMKKNHLDHYRRTLSARAWQQCPCPICRECGIDVAIFRGTERNKRRGFHNLSVLAAKMRGFDASTDELSEETPWQTATSYACRPSN